jgi:ABC-type Fe3+/spermidine/putrescine transport system ATPase subunit
MHGGRLQQYGTPVDVYARPANRIVADFMGLVNLLPGRITTAGAGNGSVETDGGLKLDVPLPEGAANGDAVEIVVRPENVHITAANGDAGPHARITERTFLGNISEYYATLASGQVLRVQTHPMQQFAPGDTVTITIDAAECSVFRQ